MHQSAAPIESVADLLLLSVYVLCAGSIFLLLNMRFLIPKSYFFGLENPLPTQEKTSEEWKMQFRDGKAITRSWKCWRKLRKHSADLKNESANCAACFFLEKSNSRPGIGFFIFEKSNRKLRRILFF